MTSRQYTIHYKKPCGKLALLAIIQAKYIMGDPEPGEVGHKETDRQWGVCCSILSSSPCVGDMSVWNLLGSSCVWCEWHINQLYSVKGFLSTWKNIFGGGGCEAFHWLPRVMGKSSGLYWSLNLSSRITIRSKLPLTAWCCWKWVW